MSYCALYVFYRGRRHLNQGSYPFLDPYSAARYKLTRFKVDWSQNVHYFNLFLKIYVLIYELNVYGSYYKNCVLEVIDRA